MLMYLTFLKQYPDGKIQKYDVSIAKNYLSKLKRGLPYEHSSI